MIRPDPMRKYFYIGREEGSMTNWGGDYFVAL